MRRSRKWLNEQIRALRLPAFRERFVEIAAASRLEHASCKQFLLRLLHRACLLKATENEYLSTRRS